jgi:hypothetical protein
MLLKFCGNTSYGSSMFQKILAERFCKNGQNFQNHVKSPIFIGTPTFFCKFNLNLIKCRVSIRTFSFGRLFDN